MRRNRKNKMTYLLLFLLLGLGVGYALLTQELTINGISKVASSRWSIYFDNLVLNPNNVSLSTGDVEAEINTSTKTDITYTITLNNPGDFYEFTVDVVNDGTIDAMVGLVSSKLNNVEIDSTHPLPSYLNYAVTYVDDFSIGENHLLPHDSTETYKVRLEYRTDITADDLPSVTQSLSLDFRVQYIQADDNAITVVHPVGFATDSWETIVAAVKSGNTSRYHVEDTKTVELGNSLGTHTLRIANISTPSECETEGFSQTACGFVLEFADIILNHSLNDSATSVGGWPVTKIRTYLNSKESTSIYNSLPTVLKNAIIKTDVVSGYESGHLDGNYISSDKLYLLAEYELLGVAPVYGGDTLTGSSTRQLDYYDEMGPTSSDRTSLIKQYNGTNSMWWLRTVSSSYNVPFGAITSGGGDYLDTPTAVYGVSPAFRLSGPASTYFDSCESFREDSWEEIVANAQAGNYSQYSVGCTKEVVLGNDLGTHALRVANNSSPLECMNGSISDAACGFVLEFTDVITNHNMNSVSTNEGGWPVSSMRTYLNDSSDSTSIYNSLPTVLKNAIIDTTTASGHGSTTLNNYSSKDKLYLLAAHEIWEDVDGDPNSGVDYLDTSYHETRQLDYYASLGVTSSNYSAAIKKYNNSSVIWWLRSAASNYYNQFMQVWSSGNRDYLPATSDYGVSPAFRLAGPSTTYVDPCYTFENDTWDTIISNSSTNNYSQYAVGCSKAITLGNDLGVHKVRVVNNSTPVECGTTGISQTACGFVLEFEDIVINRRMNPGNSTGAIGTGGRGGWPASEMRTYLNDINDSTSIINSLPSNIKNAIINTSAISGHERVETENYTSTDKLYLLTTKEVWGYEDPTSYGSQQGLSIDTLDTAYNNARQLDYYANLGVTLSDNRDIVIKQYQGTNSYWWLRTAYGGNNSNFYVVTNYGGETSVATTYEYGVSPAFRLA